MLHPEKEQANKDLIIHNYRQLLCRWGDYGTRRWVLSATSSTAEVESESIEGAGQRQTMARLTCLLLNKWILLNGRGGQTTKICACPLPIIRGVRDAGPLA